jgi:hypothetical protein
MEFYPMSKNIVVTKRESLLTKQGKDYLKVTDTTGHEWFIFDEPLMRKFIVDRGSIMEIETKPDGKFENIVSAKFIMVIPLPEIDSAEQLKTRSQCLSYSKDISLVQKQPVPPEEITKMADYFYKWIMGVKDEPSD